MANNTTITSDSLDRIIEAIGQAQQHWWVTPVADVLAILVTAAVTFLIARAGWKRERQALQAQLTEARQRMYASMMWPWYRDLMEAATRMETAAKHALSGDLPDHLKGGVQEDLRTLSGAIHFMGRTNALGSYALRDIIERAGPVIRGEPSSLRDKEAAAEGIREAVDRFHRVCLRSMGIEPDEYAEEMAARIRQEDQGEVDDSDPEG